MEAFVPADPEQEPHFEERIAVNFLRDVHSALWSRVEEARGATGQQIAHEILNRKVLSEIAKLYPHLRDECERQASQRSGGWETAEELLDDNDVSFPEG